jgi:hypothetical protein
MMSSAFALVSVLACLAGIGIDNLRDADYKQAKMKMQLQGMKVRQRLAEQASVDLMIRNAYDTDAPSPF